MFDLFISVYQFLDRWTNPAPETLEACMKCMREYHQLEQAFSGNQLGLDLLKLAQQEINRQCAEANAKREPA